MDTQTESRPAASAARGGRDADWAAGQMSAAMEAIRDGRSQDFYAAIDEILDHAPDSRTPFQMAADFATREEAWPRVVRYRAALAAASPQDRRAKFALVRSLARVGARRAADDMVRRLIEKAPVGEGARRLRLEVLLSAPASERDTAEIGALCRGLAETPAGGGGEAFFLEVAQTLLKAEAFDLAADWLRRAGEIHGGSTALPRLAATLAYRRRRWADADALWGRLGETGDPALARSARLYRARIALAEDRGADAQALYRAAFDEDPSNAEAARSVIRGAIAQGRLEDAAADLGRFEERVGRSAASVQLRASLAIGERDTAGAIEAFESGIAQWPKDIDLRCRYAELFGDIGDLAAMRRVLGEAEAIEPRHPAILARLLSSGVAAGEPPAELLAIADRLLAEKPADLGALRQKANLLIRLGERWAAVAVLRAGIDADPGNVPFWTGAIGNLMILNENAAAAGLVEKGLARFSGPSTAERIARAEILEAGDRIAEAAERAEEAATADPESAMARAAAARLWESHGLYRRAWPHLTALRALEKGGARAALTFARAAMAIGYVDAHPVAGAETEVFPDAVFDRMSRGAIPARADDLEPRVLHVTGSLAAGGSERQVALTVQGQAGQAEGLAPELVAQDLNPLVGRDFFLAPVEASGARVWSLNRLRGEGAVREVVAGGLARRDEVGLLSALPTDVANVALPLYGLILERRPRVVHLWQDSIAVAGGIAAMVAGVPRIVLGTRSTRPIERQRARRYLKAGYHALMRYPGTVMLNNSVNGARDYADWLAAPPGEIRTVYNGFDFAALRGRADPAASAAVRGDLAAGPAEVVIGGVMRCSFEKRPELWTEAVIALAKGDPRIRGVLIGEGPMRAALEDRVAAEGMSERIRFVGRQAPIEPWMGAMDILFLSSLTEGLPNVLIEAQALGVAAATMRVGGAPETVRENVSAVVIDNGPIEAIADALRPLTLDASMRRRYGEAGRAWTDETFSLATTLARLTEVYQAS